MLYELLMKSNRLSSSIRFILLFILLMVLSGSESFYVFSLAPASRIRNVRDTDVVAILNSNELISGRLNRNTPIPNQALSDLVHNTEALHRIANNYISFLDALIRESKREKRKNVRFRILFHDDADGIASAKIFEAFLSSYFEEAKGVAPVVIFEPRPASDMSLPNRSDVDAVVALDLFWAQKIHGIDMAIDHHVLTNPQDRRFAEKNLRLVNLKQLGIQVKSRCFPAVIVSIILGDYILKVKRGMEKGLSKVVTKIPLDLWVDIGLLGDFSFPRDERKEYVFIVRKKEQASLIRTLCETGHSILYQLLECKSVEEMYSLYVKYQSVYNQRQVLSRSLQKDEDPLLIGRFVRPQDYYFSLEDNVQIDLRREMINACCEEEVKNARPLNEKRVIMILSLGSFEGQSLMRINVRYDGDENRFNFEMMEKSLRDLYGNKYKGGGHSTAMVFRCEMDENLSANDLAREIQNDFKEAIARVVYENLLHSETGEISQGSA